MTFKLFIDDERFPPSDGDEWVICRNLVEVQAVVAERGWPNFISFDHDLGHGEPTGMDIAKWLVEYDLDNQIMCDGFDYYVHSQNVPGTINIRGLLDGYLTLKANDIR
jgi:hypothetical protein